MYNIKTTKVQALDKRQNLDKLFFFNLKRGNKTQTNQVLLPSGSLTLLRNIIQQNRTSIPEGICNRILAGIWVKKSFPMDFQSGLLTIIQISYQKSNGPSVDFFCEVFKLAGILKQDSHQENEQYSCCKIPNTLHKSCQKDPAGITSQYAYELYLKSAQYEYKYLFYRHQDSTCTFSLCPQLSTMFEKHSLKMYGGAD